MAFNIFSTLNQNLQNFGGDAYDAYQAGKSKVGNVASTINNNLQDFGGDIYDVGSTIKKNVSNFGTQTYNQGKNVASTIKKNVGDYATGQINEIKAIPSQIGSGIDTIQKGARDLNYQAWNAGMKALTGKNNATFSDLAPNLGEEMSRNTGKADETKVMKFVEEIAKAGYNQDQAMEILQATLAEQPDYFNKQTYGDKIRKTAVNRGREFSKTYQDFSTGKIGFGEATLRNAGDIVGLGGGVIGDTITQIPGVTPTLNAIGSAITSIPGVKPGMEAYGKFAEANPRFAENAQAVTNLGLTALGSTEGQALMKKGATVLGRKVAQGANYLDDTLKPITTPIKPYVQKGVDVATEGVKKTGSVVSAPFKSTINTVRRIAGSPEEIAGTQYAIGSKGILRNGRNLRPQTQIADEIATTNGLIRASGKKPVDVATYRSAIKDEMETIGKEINKLTGQDMSIDMSATAKKLRERAMSDTVQTLDEEGAKELLKLADKFDRKISITEAEDMNQFINALLKNKDITAKESVKQGYQQIVEGIRENLDNTISSIPGEFRELKKAYGALRNVYGDATAKEMVINRKALSSLSESFSAIEGFGDIVGGAGKVLTGSPWAGISDIGKGITKNAVGRFIAQKNDANEVIRKIFSKQGNTKNLPKIKVKEQLLLPAPKKGAKQSEVFSPIIGSKSAEELSRESMKPSIVPKAKPKATTESALKTTPVVPEKKSIVAKKEATVKTPEIKSEKVIPKEVKTDYDIITKFREDNQEIAKGSKISAKDILEMDKIKNEPVIQAQELVDMSKKDIEQIKKQLSKNPDKKLVEGEIKKSEQYREFHKKQIDKPIKGSDIEFEKASYKFWDDRINVLKEYLSQPKPKATTESAFKNNKGFINPSEIKKSLIPKKGVDEARQFYDDLVYAGNSPIVAQRETAKRFGTIRAMSASKAGTFGGEGAKEAPKTGWFKGADGKMKFEIDDSGAMIIGKENGKLSDILQHDELYKKYPDLKNVDVKFSDENNFSGSYDKNTDSIVLSKSLINELEGSKKSYLEIVDNLKRFLKENPEGNTYNPKDYTLKKIKKYEDLANSVTDTQYQQNAKSTLLHEIQHGIQEREGFATGGNPSSFRSLNGYDNISEAIKDLTKAIDSETSMSQANVYKEALRVAKEMKRKGIDKVTDFDIYRQLAGEVESRNVQTRMNMTAKERALKSPESTEDVPRNKQIVRF